MAAPERGGGDPRPKIHEVLDSKGVLSVEQTSTIAAHLWSNLGNMRVPAEGEAIANMGSGPALRVNAIDPEIISLINKSWERLGSATEVHASAESANKMALIFMAASQSSEYILSGRFVGKNLIAIKKVISAPEASEVFEREETPAYWKDYRRSVLKFLDEETGEEKKLYKFPEQATKNFLSGYLADQSTPLDGFEIAEEIISKDSNYENFTPLIIESAHKRLQTALRSGTPNEVKRWIRQMGAGVENADKPTKKALKEAGVFMVENIHGFSDVKDGDSWSPKDAAMDFLSSRFSFIPEKYQQKFLGEIGKVLEEKARTGFGSLDELEDTGKLAEFLFLQKFRTEDKRRRNGGKVGGFDETVRQYKPFVRAFIGKLEEFKGGDLDTKQHEQAERIERNFPYNYRHWMKTFPDVFPDGIEEFSIAFPNRLPENYVLGSYISEPYKWFRLIEDRLSERSGRFEYTSDFEYGIPVGKQVAVSADLLRRFLPKDNQEAQDALSKIAGGSREKQNWEPGSPPITLSSQEKDLIAKALADKSASVVEPFFIISLMTDSRYNQLSEADRELVSRGVENVRGMCTADGRLAKVQAELSNEFNERRSRIKKINRPDENKKLDLMAGFVRGVFKSGASENIDGELRIKTLGAFIDSMWNGKDGRAKVDVYRLEKIRVQLATDASEEGMNVESFVQTNEGMRSLQRIIGIGN